MTRYEPADSFETPRFSDVRTFMRLPNVRDLENADAAIVGAPSTQAPPSAMLVGGVAVVGLMAWQGLLANSPIYGGLLAGLATFVIVSLLTPRGSEDEALAWEQRMMGQGTP